MRYGILGDIHSNLHALDVALDILANENIDQYICLGDTVGYNAFPVESLEKVLALPNLTYIQGNHDEACSSDTNVINALSWHPDAYSGLRYSEISLTDEHKKFLGEAKHELVVDDLFMASHGKPVDPFVSFQYILSEWDAYLALAGLKAAQPKVNIAIFGHTHVCTLAKTPKITNGTNDPYDKEGKEFAFGDRSCPFFTDVEEDLEDRDPKRIIVDVSSAWEEDGNMYLLNPGSVGQPRASKHVACAILDDESKVFEICPFEYDVEAAAKAILDIGYCDNLALRLKEYEEQ